jgi:hypothetical protein
MNAQRAFLRCQFSAISCKRSLSTFEKIPTPPSLINKNYLQMCISQNRPIWLCLNHSPSYPFEDFNQDD